ncbi:hypothetical protein [Halostella sp. PRR32]|uniref:hypothetical protein n=1 Tax=Halostella sp. PRR32 TaxID=3098147 RepID=UPI00143CD4EE|nr:hypothetical protein [Halostella sp. PRR32]
MSRSSKLTTLLVALAVLLAAVAPAAALATVQADDAPEEAQVGEDVSVTYTFSDLYEGDTPRQWTLQGETNLTNASWSITMYDNAGDQVGETESYGGDTFEQQVSADDDVAEVEVTVSGTVPEVQNFSYDPAETFLLTEFTEVRDGGGTSTIDSWDTHHYTEESADARTAIDEAATTIDDAESNGADVSDAKSDLDNAIGFYEAGEFDKAIENANSAQDAAEQSESSAETRSMLLYGVVGLVALIVLAGGGYVLYQRQQDDYDKLG